MRVECFEKELKELELEEEVRATQRKLDSVEQRMVQRTLPPLPKEIYLEVAKHVHESEALAFSMTCRAFRDAMKDTLKAKRKNTGTTGKLLRTTSMHYGWNNKVHLNDGFVRDFVSVSEDWIKWAFSMKWEYQVREREYDEYEKEENEKRKKKFLMYVAARGGFIDVLQWLKSRGCVFDKYKINSKVCAGAAFGGHYKVLKYLKREGVPFDEDTYSDFEDFQGEVRSGTELSLTYNQAVKGGHIKVLKYLKSEGLGFHLDYHFGHETTLEAACLGGHIDMIKYLRSEGMPFEEESMTCCFAGRGGQIGLLKYLKSEGLLDFGECAEGAAEEGHLDALKYLKSEGMKVGSIESNR